MAPRRTFGSSWWGKAWLTSLETSQFADSARLGRGRTYARQDRVHKVEVAPGSVTARVQGSRADDYRTSLAVRTLAPAQWDVLVDLIVSKARYSAELLSGSMPEGLAADAEEAGAPLLPTVGDLVPQCSCPDWGDPCKHAAALCYVTCDLIDDDPFVLLFVRGRDRAALVEEIRERRAAIAGHVGNNSGLQVADLLDPVEAFSQAARPLPNSRPLPTEPGRPNPLRVAAPADSGVDTAELERLGADAAVRAVDLLLGDGSSGLQLSIDADLMRRAALRRRRGLGVEQLAGLSGATADAFEAGVVAWERAGAPGVTVATDRWQPDADLLAPARTAIRGANMGTPRKSGNALHAGRIQLRLDREGRWWRFEADDRLGWVLHAGPFTTPTDALTVV